MTLLYNVYDIKNLELKYNVSKVFGQKQLAT